MKGPDVRPEFIAADMSCLITIGCVYNQTMAVDPTLKCVLLSPPWSIFSRI